MQIIENVNKDNPKVIVFEFEDEIIIDDSSVDFTPTSELSQKLIEIIFPSQFNTSAKDFYDSIMLMTMRLETLEQYADTEIINLHTVTTEEMFLESMEKDVTHLILDLN